MLDHAFAAASPRVSPPPTPLRSVLIHGAVLTLYIGLFARAIGGGGLFGWAVGLVYVAYDTALLCFIFWRTLDLRAPRASRAPAHAGSRPALAVVIAARDEASVLPLTLAALFAQTEPPDQILIADDGSSDQSASVLESFGLVAPRLGGVSVASAAHPSLRWLRLAHGGKARALNAALAHVDADTLLTVDADTVLEPGACAAIRDAFSAEPVLVAVTGVITPVCPRTASGRLFQWFQTYEYIRNFLSRYAWMRTDGLLLISGAFAGFRRQAVIDVGGFDTACLVEDYELIHRLRRHGARHGLGWTTAVLGTARARTDAPATLPAFLRQRRRWFGGFLQTQLWYREMVGNPRYGALGVVMLPVKAIDTFQPIYGLTALALLLAYAVGRPRLVLSVLWVVGAKIVFDLAFHLWSVHLYRRWTGIPVKFGPAILAALVEPFSFQVLRHLGAAWGWHAFLTGGQRWGAQARGGLTAETAD